MEQIRVLQRRLAALAPANPLPTDLNTNIPQSGQPTVQPTNTLADLITQSQPTHKR